MVYSGRARDRESRRSKERSIEAERERAMMADKPGGVREFLCKHVCVCAREKDRKVCWLGRADKVALS